MRRRRNFVQNFPIYLFVSVLLAIGGSNQLAEAVFHTEGGNFNFPKASNVKSAQPSVNEPQYYDVELANTGEELQRPEYAQSRPENNLAGIVDELNQMRRQQELYDELSQQFGQDVDGIPVEAQETVPKQRLSRVADVREQQGSHELDELRRFGNKFRELTQAKSEQTGDKTPQEEVIEEPEISVEKPAKQPDTNTAEEDEEKPLIAQKKGQSEFVEFVEPVVSSHSKKLKNKEFLEKRIPSDDDRHSHRHGSKYRAFNFISSSGNVIFVAFVTMCCVFSVVGVVGGMYYYNHIRTSREDPFDDFTRYSPAGPGRDKLKKGGRGGAPAFGGFEKGDESLAYKAQLHHYQQTKQKIIGEQGAMGGAGCDPDASDKSDDEADLEHNFSVYECPGLAPTGDIEVQNPNFIESPTSQKKPSLK